ncbi:MAG TPA: DUF167 domain-containing protein [Candidatus Binataceae bacterium]|nr:DUF167 domain-containing protein [Candidatus Binataceae bacterium]
MTGAGRDARTDIATPGWIRVGRGCVSLEIRARPDAARSEVMHADQRGLVVAISAPAREGKANDELVRILAKLAGVARADVSIVRGETARSKSVRIATKDPHTVAARLLAIGSHLQ